MIWARIIWRAVPGWLKAALAGLVAAVLLFGAGYLLGGRDARQGAALDAARGKVETHERIDDADVSSGDADVDRKWLHERGR